MYGLLTISELHIIKTIPVVLVIILGYLKYDAVFVVPKRKTTIFQDKMDKYSIMHQGCHSLGKNVTFMNFYQVIPENCRGATAAEALNVK